MSQLNTHKDLYPCLWNPLTFSTDGGIISIVRCYRPDELGFTSWQGQQLFLFYTTSRIALQPTHLPIQWILGLFAWGYSSYGTKLTTCLNVLARLSMIGAARQPSSWHGQG
jgi:hypothetical protein